MRRRVLLLSAPATVHRTAWGKDNHGPPISPQQRETRVRIEPFWRSYEIQEQIVALACRKPSNVHDSKAHGFSIEPDGNSHVCFHPALQSSSFLGTRAAYVIAEILADRCCKHRALASGYPVTASEKGQARRLMKAVPLEQEGKPDCDTLFHYT